MIVATSVNVAVENNKRILKFYLVFYMLVPNVGEWETNSNCVLESLSFFFLIIQLIFVSNVSE